MAPRKSARSSFGKAGAASRSHVLAALAQGRTNAKQVLDERKRFRAGLRAHKRALVAKGLRAPAGPAPLLVAEGDSWFNYPFCDVLQSLEHVYDYEVESVAHAGDTIESMAYDPGQLSGLVDRLAKIQQRGQTPRAVLLSAGGNDVAGPALAAMLNYRNSPAQGLNEAIVSGMFDERLHLALITLISTVTDLFRSHFGSVPPVLIHGYDYPVPDGRGYMGGLGPLPGPWLEPQFTSRGYQSLEVTTGLMQKLIDRFNAMSKLVAGGPGLTHVTYVDMRGTLSNETTAGRYKKLWANELHPTRDGFKLVAARFHDALRRLG